jgi:hypothetical protein
MLRVRLVAAAIVAMASVLAGCTSSSAPSWMPSWLTIKPPAPPTQVLQFESEPPGADVRSADGQTCRTPCSLVLSLTSQSVNFALNGHLPQAVPVEVVQSGEPNFQPNPVQVTLQAVAKPAAKPKPRKPKVAAKTTAKPPTPNPAMAAPAAPTPDNAFSPPPQMASPSPFPPLQQTR